MVDLNSVSAMNMTSSHLTVRSANKQLQHQSQIVQKYSLPASSTIKHTVRHLALDLSGYKQRAGGVYAPTGQQALNQSTTNSLGGNPKDSLFQQDTTNGHRLGGSNQNQVSSAVANYDEADEMMDYDEVSDHQQEEEAAMNVE